MRLSNLMEFVDTTNKYTATKCINCGKTSAPTKEGQAPVCSECGKSKIVKYAYTKVCFECGSDNLQKSSKCTICGSNKWKAEAVPGQD